MMNARRISPNFKLLKLMEEEEREPQRGHDESRKDFP
jgi:hypothetical protein